ncbi:MAG TPA: hypothetical protein VMN78_08675 [Longimicrobiales bacterium]|nr:hypothetical protein [Longimicrobiales bacterium]
MRVATTILMMLFAPALLGAQQAQAQASGTASASIEAGGSDASVVATGDAAVDARIQRAFSRAEAEGMSTTGLESRVRLGAARSVAATRIATVVENRVDAMIESRDALRASGAAHSATMVELGADAIQSGARASQVAEVAAGFAGETGPRALAVLGILAAEGRIGPNVIASVSSALETGAGASGNAGAEASSVGSSANAGASAAAGVAGAAASAGATASGAAGGILPR